LHLHSVANRKIICLFSVFEKKFHEATRARIFYKSFINSLVSCQQSKSSSHGLNPLVSYRCFIVPLHKKLFLYYASHTKSEYFEHTQHYFVALLLFESLPFSFVGNIIYQSLWSYYYATFYVYN
jgi:hypothetical protein